MASSAGIFVVRAPQYKGLNLFVRGANFPPQRITLDADGVGKLEVDEVTFAKIAGVSLDLLNNKGILIQPFNVPLKVGFEVPIIVDDAAAVVDVPANKGAPVKQVVQAGAVPVNKGAPVKQVVPQVASDLSPEEELAGIGKDDLKEQLESEAAHKKEMELRKKIAEGWRAHGLQAAGVILLALLAYLLFSTPVAKNDVVEATGGIDVSSTFMQGLGIAQVTYIILSASLGSMAMTFLDRKHKKQLSDILAAIFAFVCFQIAGINFAPSASFGTNGLSALFVVGGLLVLYWAAIANTPDFSAPGTFWLATALAGIVFGTVGPLNRWLGITDHTLVRLSLFASGEASVGPQFTLLIVSLVFFAGLHDLADMLGIFVKKRDATEAVLSFGFTVGILLAYYGLPRIFGALGWSLPAPAWLLGILMLIGGLLAMPAPEGTSTLITGEGSWRNASNKLITNSQLNGVSLAGIVIVLQVLLF